jgi:Flp pilus assembly protein TadG
MSRGRDDEGTILLLTIGLALVLMALVVVVIDVSVVTLAKRGVANAADGAALVAAQQPDTMALGDPNRSDVLASRLPLDRAAVVQAVAAYQADAAATQPSLVLTASVTGPGNSEAVVQARRTVSLPFVSWFGVKRVVVRATGRARSPITP